MPATSPDSTDPVHPSVPRARARPWWRFRLSLRAMMALVLVIALPLGWKVRRAATQRRAVAAVVALGGQITYEDQIDPLGRPRLPHRPWGPAWLRSFLGDEFFREVAWVHFVSRQQGRMVDDETIVVLNDFDHLQGLALQGQTKPTREAPPDRFITAKGLARLGSLPRLRALGMPFIGCDAAMIALLPRWPTLENITIFDVAKTLNRSPTSDAGMERLAALPNLKSVDLLGTELSPATLAAWGRRPALEVLSFDGSRLARGDLKALAGQSRLTDLSIVLDGHADRPSTHLLIHRVAPRFGDEDLDALRAVPLQHLTIMGLDATDAGVGRLLQTHSFTFLALSGRGVTDASIPRLARQAKLTTLVLADTSITDAGLAQLAAIPGLRTLSLIDNAALTDEGVVQLRTFPTLNSLTIRQPKVKPATLDAIREKVGPFNIFQPPEEAAR